MGGVLLSLALLAACSHWGKQIPSMSDPMAPHREKVRAGGYSVDFEQGAVIHFKAAMPATGDNFRKSITSTGDFVPEQLDTILALVYHNPTLLIEVRGFTDDHECVGDECAALSERRAKMVYDLLMDKRFPPEKVAKVTGVGATMPVDDNSTEDGRWTNRRVEIVMALPER